MPRKKKQGPPGLTQADVLSELLLIAKSDLCHYSVAVVDGTAKIAVKTDAPQDAWRAVQSVKRKIFTSEHGSRAEIEIRLWSKLDALRLLGQYLGLWRGEHDDDIPSGVFKVYVNPDPVEPAPADE